VKLKTTALVAAALCAASFVHAAESDTTSGLVRTYTNDFNGGPGAVTGLWLNIPFTTDDYMGVTDPIAGLTNVATWTFTSASAIAAINLSFWYAVPGNNQGTFTLTGQPLVPLADTPGNVVDFGLVNPGSGGSPNDGLFTASYSNLAAGTYTLSFATAASVNLLDLKAMKIDDLRVIITAVPEPGTYALMLAGLGVVSLLARRLRKV
jgi:PEP-CTERM motif